VSYIARKEEASKRAREAKSDHIRLYSEQEKQDGKLEGTSSWSSRRESRAGAI